MCEIVITVNGCFYIPLVGVANTTESHGRKSMLGSLPTEQDRQVGRQQRMCEQRAQQGRSRSTASRGKVP